MTADLPFDKPGQFYKGNIHTHSNATDGYLDPEDVCHIYKSNGYDFISITDHFRERYGFPLVDTTPYRDETFTTLIGAELHTGQIESGGEWHILAVGLPFDFAHTADGETGAELAARAMDAGAFVAAAHPSWYNLTPEDLVRLGDVHAIEVFNASSHNSNDRGWSMHLAQVMLMRGHRYTLFASDDAHIRPPRHDVGLGWVHVMAPALEPDALVSALKAGHYYSSTGPLIHNVEVMPGDSITVECSPVQHIFMVGPGSKKAFTAGEGLRKATLSLEAFEDHAWVMVTVRDRFGNRAWTNPIWLK